MSGVDGIIADGLYKRFGSVRAVDRVSFEVEPGTILALLGPNGAGKTTVVRILTTLVRPDGGTALVAGRDVLRDPARVRGSIGLAGQFAAVDEHLTAQENLEMVGRLNHLKRHEARGRASELIERFGLGEVADRPARTHSGGLRRRLDVAASLVARPAVLFLDEPTTGLDPTSRLALWEEIRDLRAEGTTLLLTTQYLEEADRLADRVAVLNRGRLVALGAPDDLKASLDGDRLHLRTAEPDDASRAAGVLADIATGGVETNGGRLSLPVTRGTATLAEAAWRLSRAGIDVTEFALRGPSLDDVFAALTQPSERAVVRQAMISTQTSETTAGLAREPKPDAIVGPGRRRPAPVMDAFVLMKRNLLRYLRIPSLAAFSIVQSVMFVLLFTYAFGGAIDVPGVEYIDFLLPASFILALAFGSAQTGVALAQDLSSGMIDRFRSLPMARSAVLVGRTVAEVVRNLSAVVLMVAVGLLIGFRFHAGFIPAMGAVGLAVAVGFALSWVSALIGLVVRDAETAQVVSLLPIIVLIFSSSTFVPVETMPGWLEAFANVNPITKTVDAMRSLSLGGPTADAVRDALVWVTGILIVFVPLAVRRYRSATA